jgi:acyl-CoA reductase-like NAD-dependent aldehyde dehydrogenase
VTPVDGSVYVERELARRAERIEDALDAAVRAQAGWRRVPIAERAAIVRRMVEWCVARADELGAELAWQMGRPRAQGPNEIRRGFQERALYLCGIAEESARDLTARQERRLRALHPARAARRGAGDRAVELPVAHVGERGRCRRCSPATA